jgi:hypothetical protein
MDDRRIRPILSGSGPGDKACEVTITHAYRADTERDENALACGEHNEQNPS